MAVKVASPKSPALSVGSDQWESSGGEESPKPVNPLFEHQTHMRDLWALTKMIQSRPPQSFNEFEGFGRLLQNAETILDKLFEQAQQQQFSHLILPERTKQDAVRIISEGYDRIQAAAKAQAMRAKYLR